MKTFKRINILIVIICILYGISRGNCMFVYAASPAQQDRLKENSWRYRDGELISQSIYNINHQNAWEKVNGHFLNNLGEIIPGAVKKGIDVSEHNGVIDWNKVKTDGIDYAIIRCGYGGNYVEQDDKQWLTNVTECERLGIPYGVYLYSYADTLEKAESEARHTLRLIQGLSPSYPIYYDLEDNKVATLSSSMKGQIAEVFCDTVSASGYKVGIYSSLSWWNGVLTDSRFENVNWSKWVAQWNHKCTYKKDYDIWQCTSNGTVNGINGPVDLNFLMDKPNKDEISQGLIYDHDTCTWYYYTNNEINWDYTGLASNKNGWWYVENGKINWKYTGLVENKNGWWYVKDGRIDWNYTGLVSDRNGWWYVEKGKVNEKYVGLVSNKNGWWYVENGKINWKYTGLVENKNGWWYVKDGRIDWNYTGLVSDRNGWWYVEKGKVNEKYVGLVSNKNGWWYVENGKINWKYTGLVENKNGWWYVRDGGIDWNYTGIVIFEGKEYSVVNGYVKTA